ncbi:MAG: single-stranded DNA-binding protein [Christensenellales bacterium]|jgi:single-strand DNA-binding protein|nr:single-stranded DNA-binding protein [Clostridiales bacterium]
MNKIFLIGNLTRDPELRSTQTGVPVCSFTVAVNRRGRQGAEAGQPEADFFRVTTWRQQAENCNRYLAKGRKVGVSGTLTLQSYVGNDGQQRYSLEVNADEVEFLTPRGEGGFESRPAGAPSEPQENNNGFVRVDDDDLPF